MAIIVLDFSVCIEMYEVFIFLHGKNDIKVSEITLSVLLHTTKLNIYNKKVVWQWVVYFPDFCK